MPAKVEQGIHFDGGGLSTPGVASLDLTSAFTVDYWVKPETTDAEFTFTPLVGKGGTRADGFKKRQYWFYLESGGHVNLP